QRLLDIVDAGALVDERQSQTLAYARCQLCDFDVAAATVDQRVPCKLACRRDDLRLIDETKPEPDCALADDLAHPDDIFGAAHRQPIDLRYRRSDGAESRGAEYA
ncbi:MAG TPA: hypothetical protein VFN86_12880, partial [Casimicrobiaceae bacterium]|nr:hypothetical protein [Casimicrobiaceae bacterium]